MISTKEEQQAISPEQALAMLKEGNQRFIDNVESLHNFRKINAQVAHTGRGQFPFAVV